MEEMQPGRVIAPQPAGAPEPQSPSDGSPEPDRPPEQPGPDTAPTPTPAPEPASQPSSDSFQSSQAAAANPVAPETDTAPWEFRQEAVSNQMPELPADDITWTASEFIEHQKGFGWYGLLALAGVAAAALDYLITKDKISAGVIVFAALAFGVFASHKPRTQQYSLTPQGLRIGQKFYGFHDFKTFSLTPEGAIAGIVLMPLKRFMPPLTIYVSPDMEDQVIDFLSAVLPFEQHRADAVDSLLRRIRF